MTIDGRAVCGLAPRNVINPATEECLAVIGDASREQLDSALASAHSAFPQWSATAPAHRSALLRTMAQRLEDHRQAFAALLTAEQGKPLLQAEAEIGRCVHWLREVSGMLPPERTLQASDDRLVRERHVPLGVVAAITPWNFPMSLAIWKVAPALLTGNTVVLKPSPTTPLTSLKFGELMRDLLPAGVLNVVCGGDALGPWLTAHPLVDKIAFTGSTPTGRDIMRSAATSIKRLTLELGGNDAAIVLPDADLPACIPRLFWAAFANNGQFCLAAKRMYVHDDIYDRFARDFVAFARTVRVGNGADPATQIGPLQNPQQFQRIEALLRQARESGVRFLLGGEVGQGPGYFVPIAIADNPPEDAPIVAEEAFGPVLPLLRYSSDEEVIRRANDTVYGLGASVWGTPARAQWMAERLQAGTVWVNTIHELSPHIPFGGHKQSGLGCENGLAGVLAYTNTQTITVRAATEPTPPNQPLVEALR